MIGRIILCVCVRSLVRVTAAHAIFSRDGSCCTTIVSLLLVFARVGGWGPMRSELGRLGVFLGALRGRP